MKYIYSKKLEDILYGIDITFVKKVYKLIWIELNINKPSFYEIVCHKLVDDTESDKDAAYIAIDEQMNCNYQYHTASIVDGSSFIYYDTVNTYNNLNYYIRFLLCANNEEYLFEAFNKRINLLMIG